MKLYCYALLKNGPKIVPASPSRQWMDDFPGRHAYRCLPLSIANAHGWEILSPYSFSIRWNGGPTAQDITLEAEGDVPYLNHFVESHFTRGIITFHTGYLFRTEPGWNLIATGPLNRPKDGIAPLSGGIETDWLPYPFTMNWHLTRPGFFRFVAGEPFCHIFPVLQNALDDVQPEIHQLDSAPALKEEYLTWRTKRDEFMARLNNKDPEAMKQAWQKYYFKGLRPSSDEAIATHRNKVRVAEPIGTTDTDTDP